VIRRIVCLTALALAASLLAAVPAGAAPSTPTAPAQTPPTIDLLAGQSRDVGDVTVDREGTRLRFRILATGACLAGVHLAVAGAPELIPQTRAGNAIPGLFPVKQQYDPCAATSELFVELSSVPGYAAGLRLYFALHADVVLASGGSDSAWASGTGFPGPGWSSYAVVDLQPTVLTFDEIELREGGEQPIPAGYGGLAWDQVGIYNPNGVFGYTVKSETNLAFIAEASTLEVPGYPSPAGSPATAEGDMSFVGAWFSAAQGNDLPITVRGYDDGALVGETVIFADQNVATWFAFDDPSDGQRFESIDRLEMNASDGIPSSWDYFGLDDMTFYPAVYGPAATPRRPGLLDFLCWSNQRLGLGDRVAYATSYRAVLGRSPLLDIARRLVARICRGA
jgi:hypothetical protein